MRASRCAFDGDAPVDRFVGLSPPGQVRDEIGPFEHAAHLFVARPDEHACHCPVRASRLDDSVVRNADRVIERSMRPRRACAGRPGRRSVHTSSALKPSQPERLANSTSSVALPATASLAAVRRGRRPRQVAFPSSRGAARPRQEGRCAPPGPRFHARARRGSSMAPSGFAVDSAGRTRISKAAALVCGGRHRRLPGRVDAQFFPAGAVQNRRHTRPRPARSKTSRLPGGAFAEYSLERFPPSRATQAEGGYVPDGQSCLEAFVNEVRSSGGCPCASIPAKTVYGSVLLPEECREDWSLTHA